MLRKSLALLVLFFAAVGILTTLTAYLGWDITTLVRLLKAAGVTTILMGLAGGAVWALFELGIIR